MNEAISFKCIFIRNFSPMDWSEWTFGPLKYCVYKLDRQIWLAILEYFEKLSALFQLDRATKKPSTSPEHSVWKNWKSRWTAWLHIVRKCKETDHNAVSIWNLEISLLDLGVCWTNQTYHLLDGIYRNDNMGMQTDRHFVLLSGSVLKVLIRWLVLQVLNIKCISFNLVVGRPANCTDPTLI